MINIDIYPRFVEFQHILELYPLKPANKFLPEWYKKSKIVPRLDQKGYEPKQPHAKECPAIQDELTNGFILPAWSDMYFEIKEGNLKWEMPVGMKPQPLADKEWQWIGMQNEQQITLMNVNKLHNYGVFKLFTPYYFKTPKGYGLRFSDLFYHDQKNIRIMPGQVETDIWHEVNFPFEFALPTENDTKFVIKAGEPLVMITPYAKDNKATITNNSYSKDFIYEQDHNGYKLASMAFDFKKFRLHKSLDEEE